MIFRLIFEELFSSLSVFARPLIMKKA